MILNETKQITHINPRKLSNRSLVKLARRKDSVGRLAQAELKAREAKRPPKVSHSLKALEGALGRRRGIDKALADQLKQAHPRSIKVAINRAQKAHEERLAKDRQRRGLKRHEAKIRAEAETEKQQALAALRAELLAKANKAPQQPQKAKTKAAKTIMQQVPKRKSKARVVRKTAPKVSVKHLLSNPPETPQQGHQYHSVPNAVYAPIPAEVPHHIQKERDLEGLRKAQDRDDARHAGMDAIGRAQEKAANDAWAAALKHKKKGKRIKGIHARRKASGSWEVWGG